MKKLYLLLWLLGVGPAVPTLAQNWRPFRPGLIYTYEAVDPAARYRTALDSAYASGTDSVYQFRRLLRPVDVRSANSPFYYPTPNGLFGAKVVVQPGTTAFRLVRLADGQTAALDLMLRPQTRENGTWQAADNPAIQATLLNRRAELVFGVLDSVVTVRLSTGAELHLSKAHGLLQAPLGLDNDPATALVVQATVAPHPWADDELYPTRVFDWQVGDEFGTRSISLYGLPCQTDYTLRRITARTETPDSLVYEFITQTLTRQTGPCSTPVTTAYSTLRRGRWAVSLRTGEWQGGNFPNLRRLTWEYEPQVGTLAGRPQVGPVALPLQVAQGYGLRKTWLASFAYLYPAAQRPGIYQTGLDLLGLRYQLAAPVGLLTTITNELHYYRRCTATAGCREWGEPQEFRLLLPVAEGQVRAAALVYPNPSTGPATLQWPAAGPGATVRLLDALGRLISTQTAPTRTSQLAFPLLRPGVYWLELRPATGPVQRMRLVRE